MREWRERRRLTQLELALEAGVSSRHLSFVETGRSQPGRAMLLRIFEQLDIPYREQNHMLLACGHAPAFPERSLADRDLLPAREALDQILVRQEPYPAVVVDRSWNLVAVNNAMRSLTDGVDIDAALLEPPVNILRLGFHPRGLAPAIINLSQWRAHWRRRLQRQINSTGDPELVALLDEITSYPVSGEAESALPYPQGREMLGPVSFRTADGPELSFFGMFAAFDTPFEVTVSELAMELLFPADQATAERLAARAKAGAARVER